MFLLPPPFSTCDFDGPDMTLEEARKERRDSILFAIITTIMAIGCFAGVVVTGLHPFLVGCCGIGAIVWIVLIVLFVRDYVLTWHIPPAGNSDQ